MTNIVQNSIILWEVGYSTLIFTLNLDINLILNDSIIVTLYMPPTLHINTLICFHLLCKKKK